MGRQLDLKEQGRDGVLIRMGDKMRCERIYDGVGEYRQIIDGCMGLSFTVTKEDNGDQKKQGLFNYSVSF